MKRSIHLVVPATLAHVALALQAAVFRLRRPAYILCSRSGTKGAPPTRGGLWVLVGGGRGEVVPQVLVDSLEEFG